jgi:hypothetical protein
MFNLSTSATCEKMVEVGGFEWEKCFILPNQIKYLYEEIKVHDLPQNVPMGPQ